MAIDPKRLAAQKRAATLGKTTRTTRPTGASTSSVPSTPANDEERRQQIRDGLRNGNFDPDRVMLSDYYSEKESDAPSPFIVTSTGLYEAAVEKKQLDGRAISIVTNGVSDFIYPGSILVADNNLAAGRPIMLSNIPMAPRTLYLDAFSSKDLTVKNVVPTNSNMHNAINQVVRGLLADPAWKPSSNINHDKSVHASKKDMAMSFGIDLDFSGNTCNLTFASSETRQSLMESYNFAQDYFTIRLDSDWTQSLDKLFADDVKWADIQKQSQGAPLCIVTSVTYGRNIHYVKEYESSQWGVKSNSDINAYGQHAKSDISFGDSSVAQKSTFIAVGADANLVLASLSTTDRETLQPKASGTDINMNINDQEARINDALSKALEFSTSNQGNVVAYELMLISGNRAVCRVKPRYDGFVWVTNYKRMMNSIAVNVRCNAWTLGYEKNVKVKLSGTVVTYDPASKKLVKEEYRDGLFEQCYDGETTKYIQSVIKLRTNEYLKGYLDLSVRGKASSVAKWWQGITCRVDPSDGVLNLKIDGTTRAGAGKLTLCNDDNDGSRALSHAVE